MRKRLTSKQSSFVEAYTGEADGNATKAAEIAGYGGGSGAHSIRGHELLQNPSIIAEIYKRNKPLELKAVATREERQAFWTSVMNDETQSMRDRLKASEILGKCQGDFVERLDVNVNVETTTILIDGNPVVF